MTDHHERAVLGAVISENEVALHEAVSRLAAHDFSLDSHQRVFGALIRMYKASQAVNFLTVIDELTLKGDLEAVGGPSYVSYLTEGVPRHYDVTNACKVILEAATARRGLRALQSAHERLTSGEATGDVLADLTRNFTDNMPDETHSADAVIADAVTELYGDRLAPCPTGLTTDVDTMTLGGLRTQQLWVIGAQPSAGKSASVRQMERSAIRNEWGVHAGSIEVSRKQWLLQHAFALAQVPAWKMHQRDFLKPEERDRINTAAVQISRWNYRIDDEGDLSFDSLMSRWRLSVLRYGIRFFTLDYLQLMVKDERQAKTEVSYMARRLKQFAKKHDVCVVALSQMARTGDINARPTVQGLKESGNIEAAADVILLNYRPKDRETDRYNGRDEIIIGKHRNGPVGATPAFFDSNLLEFHKRTDTV